MLIGTRIARRAMVAITCGGLVVAGCGGNSPKAPTTSKATAVAPVAHEVQQYVAKVWPEAGRIWPGVVLKDRRIVIGDGKVARLVTAEGVKNLTAADLTQHKITVPSAGSMYTTWDGHPTVVINAADPSYAEEAKYEHASLSEVLFGAVTDELFHSWQQRGRQQQSGQRGTEYPLAVTPRLYRAMLFNDVLAAFHYPRQRRQRLAAAAYWYSRWQKEYPDEARRAATTDAAEGVAGYFDAISAAMAEGADRENQNDVRQHVAYDPIDGAPDPTRMTVDGEAAPLGAVSGLILDETKAKRGWRKQAAQSGQTPLAILLWGVNPVPEQQSDTLRQAIQDALAKQNSDLIPRFAPLVRSYNDSGDSLLLVPLESATGDLETGGYFTAKNVPYMMLARLSGTFQLPSGTLRADGASVLTGTVGGKQYVIVPINPEHQKTHVSGDRVRLNTGPLSGTFRVKPEKMQGRQGLIAQ